MRLLLGQLSVQRIPELEGRRLRALARVGGGDSLRACSIYEANLRVQALPWPSLDRASADFAETAKNQC